MTNDAYCACHEGFFGDSCNRRLVDGAIETMSSLQCGGDYDFEGGTTGGAGTPCEPNPCLNGGECAAVGFPIMEASCICINDFFGDLCSMEAGGNCVPNPCENGGTCAMVGFRTQREVCTCVGGFMGDECEREPGGGH